MCLFVAVKSTHTYNFFNEMSKDVAGVVRINTVLTASIPAAPLNTHTHAPAHTCRSHITFSLYLISYYFWCNFSYHLSHGDPQDALTHTTKGWQATLKMDVYECVYAHMLFATTHHITYVNFLAVSQRICRCVCMLVLLNFFFSTQRTTTTPKIPWLLFVVSIF